jgi:hypothetical protein
MADIAVKLRGKGQRVRPREWQTQSTLMPQAACCVSTVNPMG